MFPAVTSQSQSSTPHTAGIWLAWILDILWASAVSGAAVLLSMMHPHSPVGNGPQRPGTKEIAPTKSFEKFPLTPPSPLPEPALDFEHLAGERSTISEEHPKTPTEEIESPLPQPPNPRIPTVSFEVPPFKRGSSPAPSRRTSCEQVSFKLKQSAKEHCPLSPDSSGPRKISSMSFLRPKKLRKTPSAPDGLSVSLPVPPTPPLPRPKPQRLRTQPYEAPYFFPQPGTLAAEQYLAPRKHSAPTRGNSAPPSPTTSDVECDPKKPRKVKSGGLLSPTRRVSA